MFCRTSDSANRAITLQLRALKYWKQHSEKHVVFDMTDSRAVYFEADEAIVFKSSFDTIHYNKKQHISFPILPRQTCTLDQRHNNRRDIMLGFKGTVWSHALGVPHFDVRAELLSLNSQLGITALNTTDDRIHYLDLLSRSQFAAVPRGAGLHSYRFVEAMSCGAIPVVLSDDWVLPFSELIDWSQIIVKWNETDVRLLPQYLRTTNSSAVSAQRQLVIATYEQHFHNIEHAMLQSLMLRFPRQQ